MAIGFLLGAQLVLLSHNVTTLESFIPGIFERNPWGRGSLEEGLSEIFGQSSWLIPTKPFASSSYTPIEP